MRSERQGNLISSRSPTIYGRSGTRRCWKTLSLPPSTMGLNKSNDMWKDEMAKIMGGMQRPV